MTIKEIKVILEKIKRTSDLDERFKLIREYWDAFRNSYIELERKNILDLRAEYPNELVDFGVLGRSFYTEEERSRRRELAKSKPKYTSEEKLIMTKFKEIFGVDLEWLKTRKDINKLRKKGINIMQSKGDSNICIGHHDFRMGLDSISIHTFCHPNGLPYFEIWLNAN